MVQVGMIVVAPRETRGAGDRFDLLDHAQGYLPPASALQWNVMRDFGAELITEYAPVVKRDVMVTFKPTSTPRRSVGRRIHSTEKTKPGWSSLGMATP